MLMHVSASVFLRGASFFSFFCEILLCVGVCPALCTMPGNRTGRDNIVRVIELHKVGKNNREITNQTGVTESTVSRLLKKWRAEGGGDKVPVHKHAGGKALKISPKALKLLKRELDITPSITAKELKNKNPKLLGDVSVRTIQENIQKRLNYSKVKARVKPLVTAKQRRRRVQFAKGHKDWDLVQWHKVLWTDEATFCISESKGTKVWKSPTASACDPRLTVTSVKHPPYLMVWGAFGYGGLGNLVILPKGQTVNSQRYIKLLQENLGECFAKTGCEILQQDGAPCHTSKAVKQWLKKGKVEFIEDWPGQSPDISPIENLWGIMKARLRQEDTSTIPKLNVAIRKVWEEIPDSHYQNLVDSVPKRLQQVIKAKGFPIRK